MVVSTGLKLVFVLLLASLNGCTTLEWYGQALRGQLNLMAQREDIETLITNQDTPVELREKLELVLEIRAFAAEELGLPDNDSYTEWVDLDRDAVVWNVIAAPEFSLVAHTWCYPLVGCLAYRGWFDQDRAQREADELSAAGLDTRVVPVTAYSTLGRLDDPVTSVMLRWDDAALAGLIFHELAHQQVFVAGETLFNEGYATSVERAGVRRWLAQRGDGEALAQWQRRLNARQAFVELLLTARRRLDEVYRITLDPSIWGPAKQVGFGQLRQHYRDWSVQQGIDPYAAYFSRPLNNADLVLIATYEAGVHAFDALLAEYGNNMHRFHSAVAELAEASPDRRREFLQLP
ncbi:MAG: aminopeptidase [Pseudomonadota bacterium]